MGIPCVPSGLWTGRKEMPLGADPDIPRMPVDREPPAAVSEPVVRRVIITRAYLTKFGYTEGCSKCRAVELGDESQPGLAHNAKCRERIENKMKEDPELNKRLEKAEGRQNEFLVKKVESSDQERREAAPEASAETSAEVAPGAAATEENPRTGRKYSKMSVGHKDAWAKILKNRREKAEANRRRATAQAEVLPEVVPVGIPTEAPQVEVPDGEDEFVMPEAIEEDVSAELDPKISRRVEPEVDYRGRRASGGEPESKRVRFDPDSPEPAGTPQIYSPGGPAPADALFGIGRFLECRKCDHCDVHFSSRNE